jgi:hypothetical protein
MNDLDRIVICLAYIVLVIAWFDTLREHFMYMHKNRKP